MKIEQKKFEALWQHLDNTIPDAEERLAILNKILFQLSSDESGKIEEDNKEGKKALQKELISLGFTKTNKECDMWELQVVSEDNEEDEIYCIVDADDHGYDIYYLRNGGYLEYDSCDFTRTISDFFKKHPTPVLKTYSITLTKKCLNVNEFKEWASEEAWDTDPSVIN
jgi:hypothetical protein